MRKNEALPAAVRAYEQAIALAPSHAKTRTELAILLTRLDRYDDALALLEQTVREQPDRAQAHLVLGLLHSREGRYPAAIVAYQRAIAAVPSTGRRGSTSAKPISSKTTIRPPSKPLAAP